ncbi:sugar phosphate nucleotidyltransferase [Candidatus Pelagibacter sp. HIMB1321]|uniref:sugar phosphate nucleotidyltransferase n=1 Tax=Candidatus Pelagibacter sp. HIMB1321 TaxID=1388755 RepID=UPI000A07DF0B|nr:sugar phosphate nucleotidyltransferase [Candidatus Pelagibacter sp. HIMB1321]SMF79511.1 capsule biosynthesis phosphatase [Candidatus Pelagibacter sp. HIMB1321]
MIIIIPLGGIGKRFSDLGYNDPKPLVKVLGKEIIFWVLDNLRLKKKDKLYIVYNNQLEKFSFEEHFAKYPNINFLKLDHNTHGPVETIYKLTSILEKNSKNEGLLILDGDTFYKKNIINLIDKNVHTVFYHKTKIKEPIFSYVKLNKNKIYKIVEKKKISNNANTGAYFFNNIKKFNAYSKSALKKDKRIYVSDIYNLLLKNKETIKGIEIKEKEFDCLGTPKQVIDFSKKNKVEKKRFCFDLDNTLVTYPKVKDDYNTVKPIIKNIKFLNFLHSQGHYIIIYTARRMRTHNGNIKKVKKEIENLTLNQLKLFKIRYDELILGKPYANFYIDDLSINPIENLNTKLGYYETKDYLTRNFNEVIVGEKFTIKKSSNINKLNSEINFLQKIPSKIKKFFPKIKETGKNFYKMDTVDGLKLSYLLVNNLLTKEDLTNLFKKLNFIHKSKTLRSQNLINIYDNYSNKFNLRTKNLRKYKKKYLNKLNEYLKDYENFNKGKVGVIHGDPVLSNIIKKNNSDLIFLDPRGSLGKKFTIFGDINYDFAKIYQSLTGYEYIILDKKIDQAYLSELKNHFEKLVLDNKQIDNIETLKILTSSLYFTLINFHNKKYTSKFLDIACKLI